MRILRATLRILCLAIVSVAFYGSFALGLLFARLLRRGDAWRRIHYQAWARTMSRIVGCRLTVKGTPPKRPYLLVSNHLGYVDILVLASQLDAFFLSKSEVAKWPMIGVLARSFGTLFVDRNSRRDVSRVIRLIEDNLALGRGVLMFPEGTSSAGADVLPFKPSLLAAAARAELPVHTASVYYRTPEGEQPASLAVCWWGEMTLAGHLFKLLTLPSFEAVVRFGDEVIQHSDRKELARRLHGAVARHFREEVAGGGVPGDLEDLVRDNVELLQQGRELLERIDPALYSAPPRPVAEYGFGPHLRHCIDYYHCLLDQYWTGRVDYDQRKRIPELESSPEFARDALQAIEERLETLVTLDAQTPLRVRQDSEPGRDDDRWLPSTLGRELKSLSSHTVHHYALIAWALRLQEYDPGREFGVAPSTLRHWKSEQACAPSPGSAK